MGTWSPLSVNQLFLMCSKLSLKVLRDFNIAYCAVFSIFLSLKMKSFFFSNLLPVIVLSGR